MNEPDVLGGKGILITEEKTGTLATMMQPRVCYVINSNGTNVAPTPWTHTTSRDRECEKDRKGSL